MRDECSLNEMCVSGPDGHRWVSWGCGTTRPAWNTRASWRTRLKGREGNAGKSSRLSSPLRHLVENQSVHQTHRDVPPLAHPFAKLNKQGRLSQALLAALVRSGWVYLRHSKQRKMSTAARKWRSDQQGFG